MKHFFSFLLIAFFISCSSEITEKEKKGIELQITLHNASVGVEMKLRGMTAKEGELYNPNSDPNLTYDKLIQFCKEKGHDPVLFAKTLTTK
jgi:hypothetical protein